LLNCGGGPVCPNRNPRAAGDGAVCGCG
jgi:hypothetical protein